ncbi:MAG: tRNA 2-thiouridine(34) synthase MnmA [Simkaniaceae bacterium]|nr:tRNA 2-thiouridine(34) synthase MnmA [Simkaniaceae bacterium]
MNSNKKYKVAVGMSGGVDSAVTAYLLKEQGYDVFGLYMKNWEEEGENGVCRSQTDYEDVQAVCQKIDIPYYTVNFVKEYWDLVFTEFLDGIKAGHTPNPDILCNREIKFKALFEKAKALGADFLATGHYCQTQNGQLLKGHDPLKDQSYFLYTIKDVILKKVLFPIGHLEKTAVRKIAKDIDLPVFDKKDSTGICFIGKRNFKEFLEKYIPNKPGDIIDTEGNILGKHAGSVYYTIGQRKGLGIGGEGAAWFVSDKNLEKNQVIVAKGEDHPALFGKKLLAKDLSLVNPKEPLPDRCHAKIRYRQREVPCTIFQRKSQEIEVEFDEKERGITPWQSIVFYENNRCLGGAIIAQKL